MGQNNYKPLHKSDEIEERMNKQQPGSCATFIYTSGTTGPPKAVMVSHDNYTWTADRMGERFLIDPKEDNRMLSMLPLSHVAAQFVDLVLGIKYAISVFFTDSSALQGNLLKFLLVSKP